MDEVKDIESLKKEIEKNGQTVEIVNILFLDLSSSCTGYCVAEVDFARKSAKMKKAGAIWFSQEFTNQDKYHYLFNSVTNYFNIIDQISYCVCEAYAINANKMMGAQIGPELHGAIQVALAEIGVKYSTITPQTWRSLLQIKPIVTTGSNGKKERNYKDPTFDYINNLTTLPTKVISNVTKNQRSFPYDISDAMAIGCGFLKKVGITKLDFSSVTIQQDTPNDV